MTLCQFCVDSAHSAGLINDERKLQAARARALRVAIGTAIEFLEKAPNVETALEVLVDACEEFDSIPGSRRGR